jgi:Ni,Fe-hydrogenase III large subunit
VSGDSTVAYAWAYAMAAESATGTIVPERAAWLRALLLERERVANHLGDLGALGNDAALASGLAQFSRLREDWLRGNDEVFGHRLLMDCIVPGGTRVDLDVAQVGRLSRQCSELAAEVMTLRTIYDEHAGLQDRFVSTGVVTPELPPNSACAVSQGAPAGRLATCARPPVRTLRPLNVRIASDGRGDVAARVAVRFDELFESLRLIDSILQRLPAGEVICPLPARRTRVCWVSAGSKAGAATSWSRSKRTPTDCIRRCHCHDPSWQNWPVLEHAVIGNIVPDFPLINKSFNLSYSGWTSDAFACETDPQDRHRTEPMPEPNDAWRVAGEQIQADLLALGSVAR